ncbi:MAG: cobalamin biosynthesis protein [Psychromonas sp.]|nr:cobalamin biosynthesis protein [Psychromonas sp.]
MTESIAFIIQHNEYFTVLLAAISSFCLTLPRDLNPINVIEIIFQQIAKKINLKTRTDSYKYIASVMSLLIIYLPLTLIISQLYHIAFATWVLNLTILFLLLSWHDKKHRYHLIFDALTHQKIAKAKYLLKQITLRETKPLSTVGVNKATIESMVLQFGHHWFSILFWYLLAGIYGALFYRIIQICAQQWNAKLDQFTVISRIPTFIYAVMLFPVHILLSFTFQLYDTPLKHFFTKYKQSIHWHHFSSGLMLASFALSLQIQIGGIRLYHDKKVNYSILGMNTQPTVAHIGKALQRITLCAWLWLTCFTLYYFFPQIMLLF